MKINTDPKKIKEVLEKGVVEILPNKERLKKLLRRKRVRIYLGIDPTATKLHLGHTIGLRKLQQFADLGHETILVIGTGTVLAGDPSLRETPRGKISQAEIKKNIRTWKTQVGKVLDLSKIKIKYNGDWLLKLNLKDIINIASKISAVKLFQREMFQRRIKRGGTVLTHEILYPLLQGYDSVFLNVDLEIGGTDQVFNMLIGRELQKKMRHKEKFILTFPMILGIDGQPMSKSSGNCVWLSDPANQMFGKIMSIPDKQILNYFELLTDVPAKEIQQTRRDLKLRKINPRDAKIKLARELVKLYHGEKKAENARKEFKRVFSQKKIPSKIPIFTTSKKILNILDLILNSGLTASKSQAKRLVLERGVKIDGKVKQDWQEKIKLREGMILQVGKRRFKKIKLKSQKD